MLFPTGDHGGAVVTQWGLDTLFNPAKRHMDEEKRRLQSTREEVGDNSGGKRIDLESGKVHIPKPDEGDHADTDGADEADTSKDAAQAVAEAEDEKLTPAQRRARERRRRTAG